MYDIYGYRYRYWYKNNVINTKLIIIITSNINNNN